MTNESTDSFQVTCQPGFNGGLPQHFTLTVYKMSTENGELHLSANLSSALPSFTVSGLDPGSKYVGELVGHNVKGMGVPTQIHVYTLKLPEKLIPHINDGSASGKTLGCFQTLKVAIGCHRWANNLSRARISYRHIHVTRSEISLITTF